MLVFFLRNIHPILLCAIFVYLIFETQQWKRVAQETVFPGSEAEKSCSFLLHSLNTKFTQRYI